MFYKMKKVIRSQQFVSWLVAILEVTHVTKFAEEKGLSGWQRALLVIPGICLPKDWRKKLLQIHDCGGFKERFLCWQLVGESASFDVLIGGEKCLIVSLGEKRFLLKLENAKIYSEAHSPQGENFHIAKFPEQNATMRQTLKDATKYYRLTFVEKQPTLIMETDISDIKMLPNTTSVKQQPTLWSRYRTLNTYVKPNLMIEISESSAPQQLSFFTWFMSLTWRKSNLTNKK